MHMRRLAKATDQVNKVTYVVAHIPLLEGIGHILPSSLADFLVNAYNNDVPAKIQRCAKVTDYPACCCGNRGHRRRARRIARSCRTALTGKAR